MKRNVFVKNKDNKFCEIISQIDEKVEIKMTPNGYGIFAKEKINKNTGISIINFFIVPKEDVLDNILLTTNKGTYTLNKITHSSDYVNDSLVFYGWDTFQNHSCNNNALSKPYFCETFNEMYIILFSLRDIESGDEITVNYNEIYYHMTDPFECGCNSTNCKGMIKGFKHLSKDEKQAMYETDNIYNSFFKLLEKIDNEK